ncbi:PadR family transcriptional regulator [bacterium]|nr:PadR family transcriptional regulator [bacterium]
MDAQLKRGILDVCVLTAIKNEDSYGYKIIKDVKPVLELSESTLYTILKRLEETHMLVVRTIIHDGRIRKYYHITEKGLKRIEDFKNEWKELMDVYSFIMEENQ